jgi:hypothetical protein
VTRLDEIDGGISWILMNFGDWLKKISKVFGMTMFRFSD